MGSYTALLRPDIDGVWILVHPSEGVCSLLKSGFNKVFASGHDK